MSTETNSSLDTVTEQAIVNYLLILHTANKFYCALEYLMFP